MEGLQESTRSGRPRRIGDAQRLELLALACDSIGVRPGWRRCASLAAFSFESVSSIDALKDSVVIEFLDVHESFIAWRRQRPQDLMSFGLDLKDRK